VIDVLHASIALERWNASLEAADKSHRVISTKRV